MRGDNFREYIKNNGPWNKGKSYHIKPLINKICPYCHKNFKEVKSYSDKVKCCSSSCAGKLRTSNLDINKKMAIGNWAKENLKGKKLGKYKKCKICDKDFYIYPNEEKTRNRLRIFCSKECAYKLSHIAWNKGLKGIMPTPWNKGKKMPNRSGINHPMFGKNHSLETRKKISATQRGINVNDFISFIHNEEYDNNFINSFKSKIKDRDNYACLICQANNKLLQIHHIDYNKKLSTPENCCALCISCHTKTNFNRKSWTTFFKSLLSEKYKYKYPLINITYEEIKA